MALTLPVAADLYAIFGQTNIRSWGNADNVADSGSGATAINTRITWAISQASIYVLAKLYRKYAVEGWSVFPAIIFDIVARRAGVELYRTPRGLIDGTDMMNAMVAMHDDVENRLNLVLAGALVLVDLVEDQLQNVPGINNHKDVVKFDPAHIWSLES